VRVAAVADLHCRSGNDGLVRELLGSVRDEADVLVLAGDLTDTGLPAEMGLVASALPSLGLPVVAVLGNHDHESDHAEELAVMLRDAGVCVLDATVCEIDGVGFVGTKGFCGGFGNVTVQPFGERALKSFIQTSIDEAVRLENALARLEAPRRVAILHYAPVLDTLAGEPPELHAFLGSGRLASALDRRSVDWIVHGHAHHGSPFGRTPGGIAVHNVCRFVRVRAGLPPYGVFDV
jgi:Icc-related predicted phosphoesterase